MQWMIYVVLPIQVLSAVGLILVVLLQSGKGSSAMAAFGLGGGGETFFGSRGVGNFLTRTTTVLAVVFMVSCIVLSLVFRSEQTVMKDAERPPAPVESGLPLSGAGPEGATSEQPAESAAPAGGGETEPESGGE